MVSADGSNVYVVGIGGLAVLSRDAAQHGALTQVAGTAGCVAARGEDCTTAPGIDRAVDLVETPDSPQVYVAAGGRDRLITLARAEDGSLEKRPDGCLAEAPGSPGCVAVRAMRDPRAVGISADGASVYVASEESDAIAVFRRDDATGALTQPSGAAGCVIEAGGGGCAEARALDAIRDLALSPGRKEPLHGVAQDQRDVPVQPQRPPPPASPGRAAASSAAVCSAARSAED